MKIIFRADDLGFSEAVNYGIRKAIVDGVITCTGLMPNMPYAAAGYALVKDTGVEVGQHTNICVGRPLTDSARIPSLVQPSGEFCTSREIRAENRIPSSWKKWNWRFRRSSTASAPSPGGIPLTSKDTRSCRPTFSRG